MKKFIQGLTRRRIWLGVTALCSLLLGLVISGIGSNMAAGLETQDMAARWSEKGDVSQISCFFSREADITEERILSFEHQLDKALLEASIVSESENANARLWASSYSATGKVRIESNRSSVEVSAVGIGGDFFLFHPLKLVSGAYFSGNDVLTDYVVIDEDAAWQLFGSNDVAGQMVTIGGVPHMITGVVERESGRLAEAAGLTSSVAYVSYNSLENYGTSYGLNTYELVMPNPVSGYAKKYVAENIGVDGIEVEIVENSTRFELLPRLKLLLEFGTRSMSSKAIIYPYWENIARGYEDILALMTVFMILLFLYPAVLAVIAVVIAWKHKTWTVKSVYLIIRDKMERFWEKQREKKKQKKLKETEPGKKEPKEKKIREKKSGRKKSEREKIVREKEEEKDEKVE